VDIHLNTFIEGWTEVIDSRQDIDIITRFRSIMFNLQSSIIEK